MSFALIRRFASAVAATLVFLALPAQAGGHGGGEGPAPLGFVVNLPSPGTDRYLKLDLVLETANPEVGAGIKSQLPRIQHQIILLLSEAKDELLRTREGKRELAESIQQAVNKILGESRKSGVTEVLFTSFLIQ